VWAFKQLAHTFNIPTQGSSPCENNTQSKKQTVWCMNGVHSPNHEKEKKQKDT
jgi:hypothetical protein